jgi:sugar-specific transcriptional regulator TrmB
MEKIFSLMKKFNFTEYETKVYIALLKNGNATGYEISKQSSVPRSKVYNILETLLQKGIIQSTQTAPVLYTAIPVDEFIEKMNKTISNDLSEIKQSLEQFNENKMSDALWNIEGYNNIIAKSKYLIQNAKEEVLIQIWYEDLDEELISILMEKEQHLEKFVLILLSETGNYNVPFKRYYNHGFEREKLKELGSRWMTIVTDSNTMLMSTVYNHTIADAITTQNQSMVFLAKEYIVHDAYTAKILKNLDENTKKKFGDNLENIRKIYE